MITAVIYGIILFGVGIIIFEELYCYGKALMIKKILISNGYFYFRIKTQDRGEVVYFKKHLEDKPIYMSYLLNKKFKDIRREYSQ